MGFEPRIALLPRGIAHRPRRVGDHLVRVRRCGRPVAHPPHPGEARLSGQDLLHVRAAEPRLGDDDGGKSRLLRDRFRPSRLAGRVGRIPLRLHVHGPDDPKPAPVPAKIFGQIALPDRTVVTVPPFLERFVAKPWMVVALQIPQVVVGVDDDVVPAADVVDVALVVRTEPQILRALLRQVVVHRQARRKNVVETEEHSPGEHRGEGVPSLPEEYVGHRDASADRRESEPMPRPPGWNRDRPPPGQPGFTFARPVHLCPALRPGRREQTTAARSECSIRSPAPPEPVEFTAPGT